MLLSYFASFSVFVFPCSYVCVLIMGYACMCTNVNPCANTYACQVAYLQECVCVLVLVCQKEKDRGEIERKTVFKQSD